MTENAQEEVVTNVTLEVAGTRAEWGKEQAMIRCRPRPGEGWLYT